MCSLWTNRVSVRLDSFLGRLMLMDDRNSVDKNREYYSYEGVNRREKLETVKRYHL